MPGLVFLGFLYFAMSGCDGKERGRGAKGSRVRGEEVGEEKSGIFLFVALSGCDGW